MKRHSEHSRADAFGSGQQGIALIITLIMLSVITFMTITFLILSRQGASQVDVTIEQAKAKQANDAAFQQVLSQVISRMIANNNGFDAGLVVSTNYSSSPFFNAQNAGTVDITNVSYYDASGNLLGTRNMIQLMNNLMIQPRPPVFVTTNKAYPPDFRFYLDLNRNGKFDTNGLVLEVDNFGQPILDSSNNFIFTRHIGDPEWIGVLQYPDQPHSPSNLFIARFAFFAVPIGNGLDINYIHNQAKQRGPSLESYLRNEGVGTWEINLAGFLNGLNTNKWPYLYDTRTNFPSMGSAFDDALSILQYRYNGSYTTLASIQNLYPWASGLFGFDNVDGYCSSLMTNFNLPPDADNVTLPWSGADNTNHLFTTADLAGMGSFSANMFSLGTNLSTADRYTYYRMMEQIGTDSAPETNKMNLHYVNVDGVNVTNFIPWTALPGGPGVASGALAFFTNAAERLLKSQPDLVYSTNNGFTWTNLSVTNIPVYPTNYYTPAVHRMLQLAANLYDATTNKSIDPLTGNVKSGGQDIDYPSVFRPVFAVRVSGGITNIVISGYEEVDRIPTNILAGTGFLSYPLSLVDNTAQIVANLNISSNVNIYGVPWVVGARKGFPNFNKIAMQSFSSINRKVEIDKNGTADRQSWRTNVQYVLGISNMMDVEAWNSYTVDYPRDVQIDLHNELYMRLTNELNQPNGLTNLPLTNTYITLPVYAAGPPAQRWTRFRTDYNNDNQIRGSFKVPLIFTNYFLPASVYHPNGTLTPVAAAASAKFDPGTTALFLPRFGFNLTNRMQFIMRDGLTGRIIDYVQLDGMDRRRDLTAELVDENAADTQTSSPKYGRGGVWDIRTNALKTALLGVGNQVEVSQHEAPYTLAGYDILEESDWKNMEFPPPNFSSSTNAAQEFKAWFLDTNYNSADSHRQAPYTPTRRVAVYSTWQANDPLVHYTSGDLTGRGDFTTLPVTNYDKTVTNWVAAGWKTLNKKRYLPWNLQGGTLPENNNYTTNMALKDPMVRWSDDWQFPAGKLPNIGWLGRVHRGTPWQTIYMKSMPVDKTQWTNWTGNGSFGLFRNSDAEISQPTSDWAIFDLFTTAPNDNASRGQLPINQTNYAAWAAVLDAVNVVSNDATGGYTNFFIDPILNAAALNAIWQGINRERTNQQRPNYVGRVFTRLGDILSTPELTIASPFLDHASAFAEPAFGITDAAYERIPQQIMSLLQVGSPRYVIYAYGQALKPAPNSRFSSPTFGTQYINTVTNYQITAEVATRTVIRFEPSGPLPANYYDNPNNLRFDALNPTHNPVMPGQNLGQQRSPRAVIESFVVLPPE